jgi:hypothetical protein
MGGMEPSPEVRTVSVRSPSGTRETLWVARVAAGIVLVSSLLAGLGRGSAGAERPIGTYQVLFRDQPDGVQRMVRELAGGLEDVIRLRTPKDQWPSVPALQEELAGPFVGVPGWAWEFRQKGPFINYIGRPDPGSGHPAFLLLLQENVPHPGPTVLDEFHRRLGDGTLVHVGFWFHPKPDPGGEALRMPEREGWTEVVQGRSR